jgi:hypothetical protein
MSYPNYSSAQTEIDNAILEITSPYSDGFTGWGHKQRLLKLKWYLDAQLERCPTYAGEEEWIEEQRTEQAIEKLAK